MIMKRLNVKSKLILTYLTVMLLIVVVAGVAFGATASRALKSQALTIVEQTSARMADEIEYRMRYYEQVAESLFADSDMVSYFQGEYASAAEEYRLHRKFVARMENVLMVLGQDVHIGVTRYAPGLSEAISGAYHNRLGIGAAGAPRTSSYQLIGIERQQKKEWFREIYEAESVPSPIWTRVEEDADMGWITVLFEAKRFDLNALAETPYALVEMTIPLDRLFSPEHDGADMDAVRYALTLDGEALYADGQVSGALSLVNRDASGEPTLPGWIVREKAVGRDGLLLYSFVPERRLSISADTVTRMIAILCLLAGVLIFSVSYAVAQSFSRRINLVCVAMERLQEGRFDKRLDVRVYDEIGYLMSAYNQMSARIERLITDLGLANREKNDADMRALQAQINPHFLYNSLTTVIRLAEVGRIDDVKAVVHSLVRFYRMTLNQSGELIAISEEIEHVREYLRICSIRFGEYAEVEVNADEGVMQNLILPITIQPFVENVFKHAMRDDGRVTHVEVNVYDAEKEIHIFIVDDGVGVDAEQCAAMLIKPANGEKKGYGVYNVNERIHLYFGAKYGARVSPGESGGTVVRIVIPKVYAKEELKNADRA